MTDRFQGEPATAKNKAEQQMIEYGTRMRRERDAAETQLHQFCILVLSLLDGELRIPETVIERANYEATVSKGYDVDKAEIVYTMDPHPDDEAAS